MKPWHRAEAAKQEAKPASSNGNPLIPESWIAVPAQRRLAVAVFVVLQAIKLRAAVEPSALSAVIFSLLDGVFLWSLPLFAIPWLTFRPLATMVQITLLVGVNGLLFIDPIWLSVVTSTVIKYLTGTELSLSGTRVRREGGSSHLLGSYTVKYLPELTATLSSDEQLCTSGEKVFLHLSLNSTWPQSVSLRVTPLVDEGEPGLVNYTKSELGRLPKRGSSDLWDLWLPVTQSGAYQLAQVIDSKTGSPVLVSTALNAVIVPPCPQAGLEVAEGPLCQGDKLTAEVWAEGIAPLSIRLGNGQTLTTPAGAAKYGVSRQKVQVPLVAAPGLQIGLASVQDALGNKVSVQETRKIQVFRPASAQLKPQRLALLDKPVTGEVVVDGDDGPFEIAYKHDGKAETVQLDKGRHQLPFDAPGKYELASLVGQHCAGTAAGAVEVFSPPPVTLAVAFEQIKDACAGPTGIDADITLSGTPPFRVWYRAKSGGRVLFERDLRLTGSTDRVEFKPHSTGTFDYEFTAVADAYRRVELVGPEYRQQQTINELAGAALLPMRTRYCMGETVEAGAKLQGKAPLMLEYSVDGEQHRAQNLSDTVALPLGALRGGTHVVRLLAVTDARGCRTPLDVRSPDIVVRADRGVAKFAAPGLRRVTDARQRLALDIKHASPPFHIDYTGNGAARSADLTTPELLVTQPGVYKLVSFRDAECAGDVAGEEIAIELIPRPTLGLAEGQPSAATVCLGSATAVTLTARGDGPFTVRDPRGEAGVFSASVFTLDVAPAATAGPQTLYYWMNDANYKDATKPVEVVVNVPQVPAAAFRAGEHEYRVCQGSGAPPPIPVVLNGQGPFELLFDVENTATGKKFRTSATAPGDAKPFMLTSVYGDITPGRWRVSLHSVSDASRCGDQQLAERPVYIDMSAGPTLETPKESHICVGDYVDVALRGRGPFELEYAFDGRQLATVAESQFRRLSSAPGTLEFRRIRDAGGCEAELSNAVVVHELPSSQITRESQFSIHHGETVDLAFEFTGTPPFAFTYTRSVRGKIVDRKTVSDVKGHKYSIYTQEEGTYEVVELQDRYCRVVV